MKKLVWLILGIVFISIVTGVYFYDKMPLEMASHWNSKGEIDGYMSKTYGLFLMPVISIILVLLFILILKIDPLKKNIKKFIKYYGGLVLLIILFFFYLHLLVIFANLGYEFNMTLMMVPGLGVLFYFLGMILSKAKRNWFVGIRTPWTLSSDKVWDKTHLLGGKLFKIAGVIAFVGLILPDYAIWFAVVPILIFVFYLVVYSYVEFGKLRKV